MRPLRTCTFHLGHFLYSLVFVMCICTCISHIIRKNCTHIANQHGIVYFTCLMLPCCRDRLIVETTTVLHDIPYGDYFTIEGRWDVSQPQPHRCLLVVSIALNFSKKTMLKVSVYAGMCVFVCLYARVHQRSC